MTPSVLVVEPDPVLARDLEALLREESRTDVRRATSAAEAHERCREHPIDALICSHQPGVLDGIELARALREADPHLVVVLVTRPADAQSAIGEVGPLAHLSKPVAREELLAKLGPALERRVLQSQLATTRSELQQADQALRASRRQIERTTAQLEVTHSELETATERLVEAEELAAVGRVVSGIAHEISSQLALVGYAEAIKSRVADPELAEFADIIVSAQKRLAAMVDEIRDFVAGPRQIAREAADLVSAVDEALAIVRYDRGVRGRNIERRTAARPLVEIHKQKFCQVIINLISNAVLATEPGDTLRVEIEIETDADPDAALAVVRVTDWGEGMTIETLERLGEPFFTTRGDRGSGLGVGICTRIARDHGGSLTFESELGVGTTATLKIPVFEPEVSVG